ncbi:ParA family protein [Thalassospira sp.]|uniref:ParA family protein n=1 Tax=Thalassospira sp. TaxID=1912094 RepID=UPI0032EBE5DD
MKEHLLYHYGVFIGKIATGFRTMSSVITVMNMKGGVGKTTVSMHIAGMLARYKLTPSGESKKILLIDYDPQFNLSQSMIPSEKYFSLEKNNKTTLSILTDDHEEKDPFTINAPGSTNPPKAKDISVNFYSKKERSLDVIPATLDLMYIALANSNKKTKPIHDRFRKFITESRKLYDVIIIDCHPAGSIFTQTSLSNSDHVIIPVVPQYYATRGIGLMMTFINNKIREGAHIKPHILFNKTSTKGISTEESQIRSNPRYSKYCLKNTLKNYKIFGDPQEGTGFVWNSGKPYSTTAFRNLYAVSEEIATLIEKANT